MHIIYKFLICIISTLVVVSALPRLLEEENTLNAIGVSSNIIATSILKHNVDDDTNFVFAPIGFSTILAILNEGARETTRTEITNTLQFPTSLDRIRSTYRDSLQRLQGDEPLSTPQFRTWLYIYRNNTIDEEFRQSLKDNFFVDVRDINRDYYDWTTSADDASSAPTNAPAILDSQTVTTASAGPIESPVATTAATVAATADAADANSKDIVDFEELKKSEPVPSDELRIDNQKDSSKFDEVVEDKQYVEAPVIREQIIKDKESNQIDAEISENAMMAADKLDSAEPPPKKVDEKNIDMILNGGQVEVKIIYDDLDAKATIVDTAPLKKLSNVLDEVKAAGRQSSSSNEFDLNWKNLARGDIFDGDATSGLSGNSLVGQKTDADATTTPSKEMESKMLLFNGLYFRGSWAIPFQQLRSGPDDFFYTSETVKVRATLMRGRGAYRYAEIPMLDAQAVEIPYENERYALMFLAPQSKTGLKDMINKMEANTLAHIESQLQEESLNVIVPKIKLETTSRAEKPLAKLGLNTLFTAESDLSGISKDVHLQVDELVQHVALRVDEGSSSENALSAANEFRSNLVPEKTVTVDRPCLFFVRDIIDDVVIVAGKIVTPPAVDEPAFESHHA